MICLWWPGCLGLELLDELGGLRLGECFGYGIARALGEALEVGTLGGCHGCATGGPLLRVLRHGCRCGVRAGLLRVRRLWA